MAMFFIKFWRIVYTLFSERWLLRIKDRTEDRLETINQYSIRTWTNFQGEELIILTKNAVGTSVQRRERLDRGLLVNKHVYSRGQSCRHSCWRGSHMMRRRMSETSKIWLNPVQELSRRKILRVQELPREAERSTAHSLSLVEPSLVMWSSMNRGRWLNQSGPARRARREVFKEW